MYELDMRTMGLNIYMSSECTRQCEGCYYFRTEKTKNLPQTMSEELVEKILDWWPKLLEKYGCKKLYNSFAGGEPLMYFDVVKRLHKGFVDKAPDCVILNQNIIFTNGDLFKRFQPKDFEGFFVRYNVGEDDLNTIKEKSRFLKAVKDKSVNRGFVILLTDENLVRIEKLARLARENDFVIKCYPFDLKATDEDYKRRIVDGLNKILDIYEEYGYYNFNSLLYHFLPAWNRPYSPYFCGAGLIAIDTDGSLRYCTRDFNSVLGTIWELEDPYPLLHEKSKDIRMSWYNPNNIKYCLDCEVKHVCQGGCNNICFMHYGKYDVRPPFCDVYRPVLTRMLRVLEEQNDKT